MITLARRTLSLLFLGIVACGGGTSATGDGGLPGPGICGDHVSGTPTGRPVAEHCPATGLPDVPADGGVARCTTDADCSASPYYRWCRASTCQADQCFTDTDCASGQACACSYEQIGNAQHANSCVATQCRVDADCSGGQACSPTAQDLCSGGGGFFACHSSADTCKVDADCCPSAPSCRYQPTEGHWACVARCTVAG